MINGLASRMREGLKISGSWPKRIPDSLPHVVPAVCRSGRVRPRKGTVYHAGPRWIRVSIFLSDVTSRTPPKTRDVWEGHDLDGIRIHVSPLGATTGPMFIVRIIPIDTGYPSQHTHSYLNLPPTVFDKEKRIRR